MVRFVSNKTNNVVRFKENTENMLLKNKDNNLHSYVRYKIAMKFGKRIFADMFKLMHNMDSLSYEYIQRRYALTKDMLGEIRSEYGKECELYLNKFL